MAGVREVAIVALVGGAAILGFELSAARLVSPFYGQSFVVWSLVISVTLTGLTGGYFAGGRLADRSAAPRRLLGWVLLAGAAALTVSGLLTPAVLTATRPLGLRWGAALACALVAAPPMICLGALAPTLVRAAGGSVEDLGRIAGRLYAISTIGSFVGALMFGFWLIPALGGRGSVFTISLGLLASFGLVMSREKVLSAAPAGVGLAAVLLSLMLFREPALRVYDPSTRQYWTVVHKAEGLMGRVVVADLPFDETITWRYLFVDGIPQSYVTLPSNESGAPYVHALSIRAAAKPAGSRALLLGLGAGSLVSELKSLGIATDAVEIDARIEIVARRHFSLPDDCRVFVDDARHHLLVSGETYDLVIVDCFSGERIPGHLLTLEAFESVKRRLRPGGAILINYTGFVAGRPGYGSRSIAATLAEAGFRVSALATGSDESGRNLIITGSLGDTELGAPAKTNACCGPHAAALVAVDLSKEPAMVLTDDRGELELFNVDYHEHLRSRILQDYPSELFLEP